MEKWSFNMLLFSSLPKVLDLSGAEIARRCEMKQPVLSRYMKNETVLPVDVFIQICNSLRMPAHLFVSYGDNHVTPERENATLPYGRWRPIEWDLQAVELTFGDGEGQIFWKDVAEAMGVTSQKPHDRFLLRTRFPIDDFLTVCNHYNLSPFQFLIDQNSEAPAKRKRGSTVHCGSASGKATLPPPYPADIAVLCRKIDTLSEAVADLTQKYQSLLLAHEALARRVQVNIQNVHNSHIGINDKPADYERIDRGTDGEDK